MSLEHAFAAGIQTKYSLINRRIIASFTECTLLILKYRSRLSNLNRSGKLFISGHYAHSIERLMRRFRPKKGQLRLSYARGGDPQ